MRRALPYALFGAVTLGVFWKFLLFGHTLHAVVLLETQLGLPVQEPPSWLRPGRTRARVADNVILPANHFRLYNEGLKSGELRLWNPTLCCGLPIYSDPMVHPFYPPQMLLHAVLPPEPAYEVFLLLHLFFSGAAMFWLLRALGRSDPAATAGGLLWMLLGYNAMWFSTGILAGATVWGPLALLFLHRAFRDRGLAPAAGAGISMGLAILGSHPQHALHLLLFTLGWLAVVGWSRDQGWRFPLRATTVYVLLALGIGLAAILTRLETIAHGYRNPGADFQGFYGDPWLPLHVFDAIAGKAAGFENPFLEYEFTFHAGLAAVALAFAGALRNFREPRVRYLALFALATIAVAFLKPLAWLLQQVPILQLSTPSRWLFLFGLAAAILAGYGWDALRERPGRAPFVLAGIAGLAAAAVLLRSWNRDAVETLAGFAIAVAAAFALRRSPKAAAALAFAAILLELLPPFLRSNWHVDPAPLRRTPPAVEAARSREREPWRGTGSLGGQGSDLPGVIQDLSDGNNLLALFGVENAAGFEAIMPHGYVQYCIAAGAEIAPGGRSTLFLRFRTRLADAMNLKYAFLPHRVQVPPRFRLVGEFGTIRLYENPAALPRAWLVGRAIPARNEEEALERLRAREFDPATSVVLETEEPLSPTADPAEGIVTFTRRESDRVDLRVSSKAPAFLVLAENDYPGWEARVNGRPAKIHRANVAFRAVAVPAGESTVVFRFRPPSARRGLFGSALFLLLGLGLAAGPRFRRSASPPPGPSR